MKDEDLPSDSVLQVQLSDHKDDAAILLAKLGAIVHQVNTDSSGTWKAKEFLKIVTGPVRWIASKAWKGAFWAFERLSTYNERLARAGKTRQEGDAIEIEAKAGAKLTEAKARKERAEAKEQELKNKELELKIKVAEERAEMLRELNARGIDLLAAVKDGHGYVVVVKEVPKDAPLQLEAAPKKRTKDKKTE
jgi:hypothetical protein